jgi:pimeloyl-ACP methyl ester carboxylesterase
VTSRPPAPNPSWKRWLEAAAREYVATVRTAVAPIERFRGPPAGARHTPRPPVLLVHGFLASPDVMLPLARALVDHGWTRVVRVGYPSFGITLDEIARRIGRAVESLSQNGPIDLVGHSLGGFACRAYLKGIGGGHENGHRVRRFVAIGAPFGGTLLYRFAPPGIREALDPEGAWVKGMAYGPEPVSTRIVRAAYDQQILPPESASIRGVPETVIHDFGHNGLLWHPIAHRAVIEALLDEETAFERAAEPAASRHRRDEPPRGHEL